MGALTQWLSRHFTQSGLELGGGCAGGVVVVVVVVGGRFHISNISSATIFPPHSGLMHPSQLILSHDRDLKYTTGSGSSDSLLCSISRLELNGVRERVKQKEIDKRER